MNSIREKIESRLDSIEEKMKKQLHLKDADAIIEEIEGVTKFWSALNEEEKEFIGAIRFAIRAQHRWE